MRELERLENKLKVVYSHVKLTSIDYLTSTVPGTQQAPQKYVLIFLMNEANFQSFIQMFLVENDVDSQ